MSNVYKSLLWIAIGILSVGSRCVGAEDTFLLTITHSTSDHKHRQLFLGLGSSKLIVLEDNRSKQNLNLDRQTVDGMFAAVEEYLVSAKTSEQTESKLVFALSSRINNKDQITLIGQDEFKQTTEVVRFFELLRKIELLAGIKDGELNRTAIKICTEAQ